MPTMFQAVRSFFFPDPPSAETIAELKNQIASNKVMVYLKSYCPYCHATKEKLNEVVGNNYEVVELDRVAGGSEKQRALLEISGQKTVPNIFINGKHIGGNSDLQTLARSGQLEQKLR